MKRILLILVLMTTYLFVNAANASSKFSKKIYKNSGISICVMNAANAKTEISHSKNLSLVPASVLKIVTTATALELLGPDYRFKTTLEYSGEIVDGVLNGNLYVIGGGDPGLGSRHFNENPEEFLNKWIEVLNDFGIKVINGDIIADAGYFGDEPVSPFWLWEDIGNYYAAGIWGLGLFDNSFTLNLKSGKPGTRPEIVSLNPEIPGLLIDNRLVSADNSKDSAYFYGGPMQSERVLHGTIPANRDWFSIKGDIPNPPFYFACLFRQKLMAGGIEVKGKPMTAPNSDGQGNQYKTTLIHIEYSMPLKRIIRITNEKSDNMFAEYLLRHIAKTAYQKPATARDGLNVIKEFWKNNNVDVSSLQMFDGSGLSPMDKLSSDFLVRVLYHMAKKSKYGDIFEESLPLAGIEGSVSGFLKDTPLVGKVRLKSGTMQGVTCYAGYYRKNGKLFIVSLMANHLYVPRNQVRKDFEDFLVLL